MSEEEIFERLFTILKMSNDTKGAVSACLVRGGEILAEGVSTSQSVHAEYALLKNLEETGELVQENDTVYTTVEPCGKRSSGGLGEKMGDCTTNLIKAGVKNVVFAASDPDASDLSRHKFREASAVLKKTENEEIVRNAIVSFNATCADSLDWLPS